MPRRTDWFSLSWIQVSNKWKFRWFYWAGSMRFRTTWCEWCRS